MVGVYRTFTTSWGSPRFLNSVAEQRQEWPPQDLLPVSSKARQALSWRHRTTTLQLSPEEPVLLNAGFPISLSCVKTAKTFTLAIHGKLCVVLVKGGKKGQILHRTLAPPSALTTQYPPLWGHWPTIDHDNVMQSVAAKSCSQHPPNYKWFYPPETRRNGCDLPLRKPRHFLLPRELILYNCLSRTRVMLKNI